MHHFQKPTVRRIIATSDTTIPARSEAIITEEMRGKINGKATFINDKIREDNENIKLLVV